MVAPLIIGGAIAAGSSILGGMMNKSSGYAQWKRDADLQREFAQKSLQWRMQDAKKAGLHPTVAAGASPGQSPIVSAPTPDNGLSQAGQAISNTLIQKKQAELIDAQIANINAQTRQLNEPLEINGQQTSINNIQPQATKNIVERPPNTDRPKHQKGSPGDLQIAKDIVFKLTEGVPVEAIENEYGELVSLPYGVIRFIKDLGYNINDYRNYGVRAHDAFNRNLKLPRGRGMLNR